MRLERCARGVRDVCCRAVRRRRGQARSAGCPPAPEAATPPEHSESLIASTVGEAELDFNAAQGLIATSCAECHGDKDVEGGFRLQGLATAESLSHDYEQWMRLRQRVADGSMPPDYAEPLGLDDRMRLVAWLDRATGEALRREGESPGPPMFRRMAEHEYSNTIRDLLGIALRRGARPAARRGGRRGVQQRGRDAHDLADPRGEVRRRGGGGAGLRSKRHRLAGAVAAASGVGSVEGTRSGAGRSCWSSPIARFADRSTRRRSNRTCELFQDARARRAELRSKLCSMRCAACWRRRSSCSLPRRRPRRRDVPSRSPIGSSPTRLSYFLWASMPDRKLREAADAGRLSDPRGAAQPDAADARRGNAPERLARPVRRPVVGHRGPGPLERSRSRKASAGCKDHHIAAMRNQPVYIFESILRNNASLLELIDSDWTFTNEELIRAYKLDRRQAQGKNRPASGARGAAGRISARSGIAWVWQRHGGVGLSAAHQPRAARRVGARQTARGQAPPAAAERAQAR